MSFLIAQAATTSPASPAQSAERSVGPMDLNVLDWNGWGFEVRVGVFWLVIAVLVGVAAWWLLPRIRRKWWKRFRTKSIKLKFGKAEWEICPDTETQRIAHQAWVEIKSRKVGVHFEEGLDVIVDVYSSWYQLFGVLRDLAKSIPADRLRDNDDARSVIALLMKALNDGLRPHLTRWQAKFSRWYDAELAKDENRGTAPQDIQRRYPQYDELVADLVGANEAFVAFADSLEKVVKEDE